MNLRWTILGLIFITLLGLILIFTVSLQSILVPHFRGEEQRASTLNIQRVRGVLDSYSAALADTARDWSRRDDSYDFVLTLNPGYIQTNLEDSTFIDLHLHLMAFYNQDGKRVYGKGFDPQQGSEVSLPVVLPEQLEPTDALLQGPDSEGMVAGILVTENHPLILVSAPILRTGGEGPPAGRLVIGRYLDSFEIQRIASVVQFPLLLLPYNQPDLPEDFQNAQTHLTANNPTFSQPLSEIGLAGYVLLTDFYNQPAYILRIEQARTIFRNSQFVLRYLYTILISGTLLFSIITFFSIDRLVLARLRQLGNDVVSIGRSGNLNARVNVTRRDELSRLAVTINQMLSDLQQSQNRRKESEERFHMVVESMDDIVFIVDQNVRRLRFFGEKARSLGFINRVSLPGQVDESAMPLEDFEKLGNQTKMPKEAFRNHLEAFKLAQFGRHITYEWSMPFEDQVLRFQTALSPVKDDQERITGLVGVSRDITHLKQLDAALRQRVQELNALQDLARSFLEKTDTPWMAMEGCRLLVEQFDLDAAWVAALDEEKYALTPLAYRGIALEEPTAIPLVNNGQPGSHPILRAIDIGQPITFRIPEIKEQDALLQGERMYVGMLCIPLKVGEQPMVLSVYSFTDHEFTAVKTQLVQAVAHLMAMAISKAELFEQVRLDQQRMQNLSHRLVEIQEEESKRIAMELHDEIGQLLTGLKLQLDISSGYIVTGQTGYLNQARTLVEELLHKVRNLSLDLRPSMLDDLGLLPALLWHFDRFTALTGVNVNFQQHNLENRRFSAQIETVAYRVVQEALTNAARHARVSEVAVRLLCTDTMLTILVEDRGKGFSTTQILGASRSRGLMSIRERIALVGGKLGIDSVPGWGTSLQIELPVSERITHDHNSPRR